MIKNKKAYSLSGWTEVALFTTLFMLLIIILVANMNVTYDANHDGTFGLSESLTKTQADLTDYQSTLEENTNQGTATSSGDGISLSTTWSIINSGLKIMWTFLSGGFIEEVIGMLRFPTVVGTILRILFVLSIGFILLKLILKIKP